MPHRIELVIALEADQPFSATAAKLVRLALTKVAEEAETALASFTKTWGNPENGNTRFTSHIRTRNR